MTTLGLESYLAHDAFKMPDGAYKEIHDVLNVFALGKNLLATSETIDVGLLVQFDTNKCFLKDIDSKIVAKGTMEDNLYKLCA